MSNNVLSERDKEIERKKQEVKDRIMNVISKSGLTLKLIQDIEISLSSSAIIKMDWIPFATADQLVKEIGNKYGSGCIFGSEKGIILNIQLPFEDDN